MTPFVTFEEATLLYEAGLKQPAPEFGQMWWNIENETLALVISIDDDEDIYVLNSAMQQLVLSKFTKDHIYAPHLYEAARFEFFNQFTSHAPDWAKFIAQDRDGEVWAYEQMPEIHNTAPFWKSECRSQKISSNGGSFLWNQYYELSRYEL